MKKLYLIGTWYKDGELKGGRVIDIEQTRNALPGNRIQILDIEPHTLIEGINQRMIVNLYLDNKGTILGRHGVLTKYPQVRGNNQNNIVILGRRNCDTVDYITVDGIIHTCSFVDLMELSSYVGIANATIFTRGDKYILKGTNWKIRDDLTMAEMFIDGK